MTIPAPELWRRSIEGWNRMRRFRVVMCALVAVASVGTGFVAAGVPAVAAPPARAPGMAPVACAKTAVDEASARGLAQRCQTRVEVMAARTERSQTFSNPDGTTSRETSAAPRRVH